MTLFTIFPSGLGHVFTFLYSHFFTCFIFYKNEHYLCRVDADRRLAEEPKQTHNAALELVELQRRTN